MKNRFSISTIQFLGKGKCTHCPLFDMVVKIDMSSFLQSIFNSSIITSRGVSYIVFCRNTIDRYIINTYRIVYIRIHSAFHCIICDRTFRQLDLCSLTRFHEEDAVIWHGTSGWSIGTLIFDSSCCIFICNSVLISRILTQQMSFHDTINFCRIVDLVREFDQIIVRIIGA